MKKKVPIPVYFAMIWILAKALLFTFDVNGQEKIGVFLNLFLVLFVIFASLHDKVKREKKLERYASNFKTSLKSAGIYIVLVTFYVFIHHSYINPGYLKGKEMERVEQELAKDFEVIKKNSIALEDMTKEEYETKVRESAKIFSSISLNVSIYFLGLFFMSLLYSIIVPIFYKKIVLRV